MAFQIDHAREYTTAEVSALTGLSEAVINTDVGRGFLPVASRPRRPRRLLGRDVVAWFNERRFFGENRRRRTPNPKERT